MKRSYLQGTEFITSVLATEMYKKHPTVFIVHTFFCRVYSGHWTDRAFSLVVVNPHFDLVGGERGDALILEDVSGSIWRCDGSLHPALCPEWAESQHISKAWTALQLLRNRLRRYKMTQGGDSRETCMTDPEDINTLKKCSPAHIRALSGMVLKALLHLHALIILSGLSGFILRKIKSI